ncbi:MRN complex-interacting protein [Nilaparvata lugens]|uniref:MRN complex-interacting protein n=1 Tax=Nilaparvata lugens TaxID=108931 RepID=UPI00193EB6D6|nr:MRN complex-interacting protein [Nilaparvata lugens]
MPQEQFVIQCYSCEMFQAHIVKKSNQWQCKVCGEKQSIKKVFTRGDGKHCREQTQYLNSLRQQMD